MPFLTATVTDERDMLATFASQQIRQLATTLQGLDEEQLRATPTASAMSLGALARHVSEICRGGLVAMLDPDFTRPEHPDAEMIAAGGLAPEAVRDTDTAASLIEDLHAAADQVESLLREGDLDRRIPVPDAPWFPTDLETWPARWVAAHVIEEVARHAGHADIIRESIDGKSAYELNALADGEEWPPASLT